MWPAIVSIVGSVFSAVSGGFKAVLGVKQVQADVLKGAMQILQDAGSSAAQREHAIASVVISEAQSSYPIAAIWRPLLMLIFAGMLISFWLGYVPPGIQGPLPPMLAEIFLILKIGIGGYIPARTVEKIIDKIQISKAINAFIDKKLV